MVRSWILQNTSPPWKKKKKIICMWWRKLLISLQSEWNVLRQRSRVQVGFLSVLAAVYLSLSFVCTACILSVLICICLAGGSSLLGSELQLRCTFTWIRTEPSSHRACKFLDIVIFCLSTVKSRPLGCWKRRFYHSKPHPNTKGAQVLHLQHQWHSALELRLFFWG